MQKSFISINLHDQKIMHCPDKRDYVDSKKYPFNCNGVLKFKIKNSQCIGTGFLIGPDLVLTSAHNIYTNNSQQIIHTNIRFYPNNIKPDNIVDHVACIDFRFPDQLKKALICKDEESITKHDYALLKLANPVVKQKYMKLLTDFQFKGQQIGIYGFPQDKITKSAAKQVGSKDSIINAYKQYITHKVDTSGGQSGSPITIEDKYGSVAVIGIHKGWKNGNNSQISNVGVLFTEEKFSKILVWEKQMMKSVVQLSSLKKNIFYDLTKKESEYFFKKREEELVQLYIQKQPVLQKPIPMPPPISQKKFKFTWDKNPQLSASKFLLKQSKIVSNQVGQTNIIISKQSIPKEKTSINFNITKYGEKGWAIYLGIITQINKNKFGNDYDRQIEGVLSFGTCKELKKGDFWLDGSALSFWDKDLYVPQGKNVRLDLDLENQKAILVTENGNKFFAKMPKAEWLKFDNYVYVAMCEKGATVQIK